MSRQRIIAKLRKNYCYAECARMLDDLGLAYDLHPPTGKGHPFLLIQHPDPEQDAIKQHVATTPHSRSSGRRTIADLRKKLIRANLIAPSQGDQQ
jgi:hypothetical protein